MIADSLGLLPDPWTAQALIRQSIYQAFSGEDVPLEKLMPGYEGEKNGADGRMDGRMLELWFRQRFNPPRTKAILKKPGQKKPPGSNTKLGAKPTRKLNQTLMKITP